MRNPPVLGSVVDLETFWKNDVGLRLSFQFFANPNAYLINQQGRATILDFFSKIFALAAAASGALALVLTQLEALWDKIQEKRNNLKQKPEKEKQQIEMQELPVKEELN